MPTTLYFVQSDTLPQIKLTLKNEDDTAKNLTGKTVALHAKPATGTGVRFTREAIFPGGSTDRLAGICYIQWLNGDLNRPAGSYNAEIEIYDPSTSPAGRETVYDFFTIVIREDIADIEAGSIVPAPTTPSPGAPDP
jgi:hypothetical protein